MAASQQEWGDCGAQAGGTSHSALPELTYSQKQLEEGRAELNYAEKAAHDMLPVLEEQIQEAEAKYKNPRNLCSGSVRQLNSEITAKRNVKFYAFTLVSAKDVDFHNPELVRWNG